MFSVVTSASETSTKIVPSTFVTLALPAPRLIRTFLPAGIRTRTTAEASRPLPSPVMRTRWPREPSLKVPSSFTFIVVLERRPIAG